MKLGSSFDVVEALRSLATDVSALQEIAAALEARIQVLEAEHKPQKPAGPDTPAPKPTRSKL